MEILKSILLFMIGFLSCALILSISYSGIEIPFSSGIVSNVSAPSDIISLNDIKVYSDKIVINIPNASLSSYAATGSMKPVFDIGANGIRIVPKYESQITTGDIISFARGENLIVHRVIQKGQDENGIYFITKGDNNVNDDGKVYFKDVRYLTVGVLY